MEQYENVHQFSNLTLIEYTDSIAGAYCGRLLADAGVNVIKVEPPDGDPTRLRGPFLKDDSHLDRSGLFHYLNANKQSLVLSPKLPNDLSTLCNLLRSVDMFTLTIPPSTMTKSGLGWDTLHKLNSQLIVTTITPFGEEGPYMNYTADDLIISAMGGLAYATPGFPDETVGGTKEPPLRPATPISEFATGIAAATATIMALISRNHIGLGHLIDVGHFKTMASLMAWDVATASYLGVAKERPPQLGSGPMPNIYLQCKDGYVAVVAFTDTHWKRLVKVMGDPEWAQSELFATSDSRAEYMDAILPQIKEWSHKLTKEDIFNIAPPEGIPCFPAFEISETVESEQVRKRGSLQTVSLDSGMKIKMPRSPIRSSRHKSATLTPGPNLGQHTYEILAMLDAHKKTQLPGFIPRNCLPLEGIRIVDLGHSAAVPFATQWMAYMGAEVIRIESRKHGVSMRRWPPYADGVPGENRSGLFNLFTNNNLSCTLNLTKPTARELVKEIIAISDVVVENLATGAIEKLGLGYSELQKLRPDIVMVSLSAFGRTGPMKNFVGFHSAVAMYSGLASVTGYVDGHPRIAGSVLPDVVSGAYIALSISQALYQRAISGNGDFIEIAMAEAIMSTIPEAIIDYTLNGTQTKRSGNQDRMKAPHGIYPCKEEDSWIAISVQTDSEWAALCSIAQHPEWAKHDHYKTPQTRLEFAKELDSSLMGWTRTEETYDLVHRLQAMGIASGPVLSTLDLIRDQHLKATGSIVSTNHPEVGQREMISLPWVIDSLPEVKYVSSPTIGQNLEYVLGDMLGVSSPKIKTLIQNETAI